MGRRPGLAHARAAGWALVGIVSVTAGTWVACRALGHGGDPWGLAFTHCTVTAGAILLFALPVGMVGWDAAFAALLVSAAGLPLDVALAVTVLVRFQQVCAVVVGAVTLLREVRAGGREAVGGAEGGRPDGREAVGGAEGGRPDGGARPRGAAGPGQG
jgi:hypothetical protein